MNQEKPANQVSATICSNCSTTTTPLWRRAPNGDTICNACGLYLKAKNTLRPPTMKRNNKNKQLQLVSQQPVISAANAPGGTCPGNGQCNGTGGSPSCAGCPAFNQHQVNRHTLICANCRTTTTPLWRRDNEGNTICNACGLYYKLHNVHRPVSMKRSLIKRRKRIVVSEKGCNEDNEEDELDSSSEDRKSYSSNEDEDDDDDEEKVKLSLQKRKKRIIHGSHSDSSQKSRNSVPPIEDYIEPKRLPFQKMQQQQQQQQPQKHTTRLPSQPRTPPLNPTLTTTTNNDDNNTNYSSSSSRPLPTMSTQRFDPLFDYRTKQHSMNLPPIMSHPYQDLDEFDEAMTRLERLRRRVLPEQSKVLSKLTGNLEDIVREAEKILLDNSQQQQQQQKNVDYYKVHNHSY